MRQVIIFDTTLRDGEQAPGASLSPHAKFLVARALADHGVNVTALKTQSRPGPETGTPMFTMRIEMTVPAELDRLVLRERLERVAADLRVDLVLTEPTAS